MFLEKIEILGFKSFAQKTVLEFPRPGRGCPLIKDTAKNGSLSQLKNGLCGVVCVVGPNGSGKSNIVDAVRWVLGEQSLKNLRGKKSEDVIFSGSEKKSRLNLAQVTLQINNEDGSMPIDYPQVLISRKFYRNGESEYLINKRSVRLQDILMLVAKSNFGQKSYSIISQGTVDAVLMDSPSERKEYFDEAVGVKQFQLKRDQSINKLENAWQNLKQAEALLLEIEPRLRSLTRQVKRLERREKVEKKLRFQQKQYYGFLWQEINLELQKLKPKYEKVKAQIKPKEKEVKEFQQQLDILEKEDSRTEIFNRLQKDYQNLLIKKNEFWEKQVILENKIKSAQQQFKKTELPYPEIIKKIKEINKIFESILINLEEINHPQKLGQLKSDIKDATYLLRELLKELESPAIKEKVAFIDQQLLANLENIVSEIKVINRKLQKIQKEIQNFNLNEEKKKGKFFSLQRQIQIKQKEFNELLEDLSQLRVEVVRLETKKEDLEKEILEEVKEKSWLKDFLVEKINESEIYNEIQRLKRQLELIGSIEPETVREYQETKERYDFLSFQAKDLKKSIASLEKIIDDLDKQIQVKFDIAFKNINKEFQRFFKILFSGGKAELVLLKEDLVEADRVSAEEKKLVNQEVLTPNLKTTILDFDFSPKKFFKKRTGKVIIGIDISATPPGKKISNINILSGGERALTSIALICAIISNNPSPFVILDEVDAALDEANSQKFAQILENLAHRTQFIVITHNWATMERANVLYGVTMDDEGVSKILSLRFEEGRKLEKS